jgi:uncharacterized membrane protein YeaQ/YmgE (transglycosylase-associated protein family)
VVTGSALAWFSHGRGQRGRVNPVTQHEHHCTQHEHQYKEGLLMHLLWTLIVGLVVGALAKLIMPGRDPGGIIVTMLLGIAGAFVARFLGRAVGIYQTSDVAPGILASIIGAIILLGIYRLAVGRRRIP